MNLDWAVWDIGSTKNQHPINPTNADGKPVDRQGNLCSTTEPPPKGFTGCPCSRYGGEGNGVHCGIGAADGFLWELGTPYTLNISLLDGNSSGALFGAKITNEKTQQKIDVGKIYSSNPGPDKTKPEGYDCSRMFVGGGSFQEYYDGGNFTSWVRSTPDHAEPDDALLRAAVVAAGDDLGAAVPRRGGADGGHCTDGVSELRFFW